MGFFDFFKKKEEEVISFSQIDDWIQTYVQKQELHLRIRRFEKQVKVKIEEARDALAALEKAGLLNENIPVRAKQIMDGNRKTYIQKVNQFLDSISVPKEYMKVRDFSKSLTKQIDDLSKDTQRSYFVLKEFLNAELAKSAITIKDIENLAINFREELEKSNLYKLEDLSNKLLELENSKVDLANLKKEKESLMEEKNELEAKLKVQEEKLEHLKHGSLFKQYQDSLVKDKELKDELLNLRKKCVQLFSTIERPLKKYQRMSLKPEIIDNYLADPLHAILNDKSNEIIDILLKMKNKLNELGLKEKKEDAAKKHIDDLNKEVFDEIRSMNDSIKLRQKENHEKIVNNNVAMQIKEKENFVQSISGNIKEFEARLVDYDNRMERISPNLIKTEIKNLLKDFNVTLKQ